MPRTVASPRPALATALAAVSAFVLAGCAGQAGDVAASNSAPAPTGSTVPTAATPPSSPLGPDESYVTVGVATDLPDGVYVPEAPAGGTDDYRCFLADPGLTTSSFVTGVLFLPSNPAVVHHSIVFRVEPDQVAAAEAKDAADPRPGWQCFGGPGLPSSRTSALDGLDSAPWLAGWAPGGGERDFGDGLGVPLAAGSRVVIQMHYNLRETSGQDAADATDVRLRVSPADDVTPLRTSLLPAPVELPCASGQHGPLCTRSAAVADVTARFGANAGRTIAGLHLLCGGDLFDPKPAATQSCTRTLQRAETVRFAAGHMHLLGRSITIVANKGRARETTLLDVPLWDFDNQSAQPLEKPVHLRAGDTVTVTCTHDATLRDQLPALQDLPDRYVVWGEGTTDEMCLGILLVTD